MNEYRYKINSTGGSSAKYGKCEVCGEYATEVFSQSEERKYFDQITQKEEFTYYKCNSYFGHRECLEGKRR